MPLAPAVLALYDQIKEAFDATGERVGGLRDRVVGAGQSWHMVLMEEEAAVRQFIDHRRFLVGEVLFRWSDEYGVWTCPCGKPASPRAVWTTCTGCRRSYQAPCSSCDECRKAAEERRAREEEERKARELQEWRDRRAADREERLRHLVLDYELNPRLASDQFAETLARKAGAALLRRGREIIASFHEFMDDEDLQALIREREPDRAEALINFQTREARAFALAVEIQATGDGPAFLMEGKDELL